MHYDKIGKNLTATCLNALHVTIDLMLHTVKYVALLLLAALFVTTHSGGLALVTKLLNICTEYHFSEPSGNLLHGNVSTFTTPFGMKVKHLAWDLHLDITGKESSFLAAAQEVSVGKVLSLHHLLFLAKKDKVEITVQDEQSHFQYVPKDDSFKLFLNSLPTKIQAQGTLKEHFAEIHTFYQGTTFASTFKGSLDNKLLYQIAIETLTLTPPGQESSWHLKAPTKALLHLVQKEIHIPQFCLVQNNNAQLCAQFNYQQDWRIQAQGQQLSLNLLERWFPSLGVHTWLKEALHTTRLREVDLDLDFGTQSLQVNALTEEEGTLKAEVSLITDHLQGNIQVMVPTLPVVKGKLHGQWTLAGTLETPELRGTTTFQDVQLSIPRLASTLTLRTLEVSSQEAKQFTIQGDGNMGGPIQLQGQIALTEKGPELALNVTGKQLLLSNTPEYHIIGSPNLHLELSKPLLKITGDISIDEAQIVSKDTQNVKTVSSDVRLHEIKEQDTASGFGNLQGQLNIHLGKKTLYKGYGLTTQVEGSLVLHHQPGQVPIADGQLLLTKGKYRYLGKTFELAKGILHFSHSPITDPVLDVHATRTIKTTPKELGEHPLMVGLAIYGPMAKPHYRLFSNPTLPEADIFSYLILGVPSNQTDASSSEALLQAASELATYFGSKEEKFWLTKLLALDDMGISKRRNTDLKSSALRNTERPSNSKTKGSSLENTEFYLGKQISKRLYVHYSIGIADSLNTIKLRYLLGPYLTLEVTSHNQGQGNGGELLFTVDR